jgi:ethanolamine-phosphate cytidylyltransferase
LFNDKERLALVEACKWADEVVFGVPYTTQLDDLIKYDIDYCLHGEDISVDANGRDSYEAVKEAGKFKLIKRTEGVSTTDIVDRILNHALGKSDESVIKSRHSLFATARKVSQFSQDLRPPKSTDRIVYVDGGFDLFHAGHADLLRRAREAGDYVIVGVQNDEIVRSNKGAPFPILSLTERVLSVLACKYVDDVIIGAPAVVDDAFLDSLRVNVVVYHRERDAGRHAAAGRRGILRRLETSFPELSTRRVSDRILTNRQVYEERNARKEKKEAETTERLKAMNISYKVEEI